MSRRINLSERFESFLESQVASGKFRNADEVVEEALRQMESRLPKPQPTPPAIETPDAEIELGSLSDISALMSQMQREAQAAESEEED